MKSNYKEFYGFYLATSNIQGSQNFTVESIELNPIVYDSEFEMPVPLRIDPAIEKQILEEAEKRQTKNKN